ncbi:MAG: hypothetical protein ABIF19_05005 [Planctomycetota bacterium]
MATQRIIIAGVACFAMAVFTGQALSWASASNPKPMPLFPPAESLRGLTDEEKAKAIEKWRDDREQQQKQMRREHVNRMATEAWKRLLRVNEQQWVIIEQKINKVYVISWPVQVRAFGSHDDAGNFHWNRPSRDGGPMSGKTREQMPEVYRAVEELIDLLEDKNSKDEQIREKMDALQQVRDKARKELAQVEQELAAVPMTPRQEAIFLIMEWID